MSSPRDILDSLRKNLTRDVGNILNMMESSKQFNNVRDEVNMPIKEGNLKSDEELTLVQGKTN